MIPASFDYVAPRSLDEALQILAQRGAEVKILAGGHSLLPMMKLRLAAPAALIDLGKIAELRALREDGDVIAVGAMTTHAEIERSELLRRRAPLLAETAAEIGDVQVRNRGTIGGSVAHADPAADYPAALLALDAELVLASQKGTRTVPVREFFVEMMTTALAPGELVKEIRFAPDSARTGAAYRKLHQPASGFALVGVAARVTLENGKCSAARVGVTGASAKAYRATGVEQALAGQALDTRRIAEAAKRTAEGVELLSDLHASSAYRKAMAEVFTRRALTAAFERARKAK